MARGRKRHSNNRHGRFQKKRKQSLSKKDIHHLQEFGETHPSEESQISGRYRSTIKMSEEGEEKESSSESDSEEEEHDVYKQLLSTLGPSEYSAKKSAIESEDSEDLSSEEDMNGNETADRDLTSDNPEQDDDANSKCDTNSEESINKDTVDAVHPRLSEVQFSKANDVLNEDVDEINEFSEDEGGFDETGNSEDPFFRHLQSELPEEMIEKLSQIPTHLEKSMIKWPNLGQLLLYLPILSTCSTKKTSKTTLLSDEKKIFAKSGCAPKLINISGQDWSKLHIRTRLHKNLQKSNACGIRNISNENEINFTPLQNEVFSIISTYKDFYYPERKHGSSEEVRFAYTLHAVNHILKTRNEILKHNSRLESKVEVPNEFRDQGLVRPKVLILVPFRERALRIVQMIISILVPNKKDNVLNKKRFLEEYTGGEIAMPKKNPRPEDYESTFAGNTDDNFKIGLGIAKKSLKLYTDFYSSDILLASPLGLRVLIGAEGEKERDFDYLASLEILIMDDADLFVMQNWDHMLHLANHLHLQPSAASTTRSGTDFSRVRTWAIEGHTAHYRQTIIISSSPLPGPGAFFFTKCRNYEGAVRVANPVLTGSICQVVVQMPQVFHRMDVKTATEAIDARFHLFTNKVLSQYKDKITKHVMIYVPLYFDFIRIRNYLKKEEFSFVQICEYSKDSRVAQARDMFFHGKAHFLLYSERFHFFRRVRVKGIKHIIFYQPPSYPHFYSEMCNFMQAAYQRKKQQDGHVSVAVLYSRHDAEQLAGIVGSDRAAKMMTAVDRNVHMFVTGE